MPAKPAAHFVVVETDFAFGFFKYDFNGLITNDKFCMVRTGKLKLSHWRLPLKR
jgi:hypothetical protein